jgi:hypothetical protein
MSNEILEKFRNLRPINPEIIIEKMPKYEYQSWCLFIKENNIIQAENKYFEIQEVEKIICGYLASKDIKLQILGYLSVIFWGFAGSSDFGKKPTEERALSRIKNTGLVSKDSKINDIKLINLNTETVRFITDVISNVIDEVSQKNYSTAIAFASLLPQLGFSFATKLIMFIDPNNCGVLDKVVAKKLELASIEWTSSNGEKSYLKSSIKNYLLYSDYCSWLQKIAPLIKDENNESLTRAVDVERFIFSLKP